VGGGVTFGREYPEKYGAREREGKYRGVRSVEDGRGRRRTMKYGEEVHWKSCM